jgi:predicted Fe-Mo cluster-binding NifX family protein
MKIAVETNDGVKLSSPFSLLQSNMVYEVDDRSKLKDLTTAEIKADGKRRLRLVRRINDTNNLIKELGDCSSIISHNLNRTMLNTLQKSGVEVYNTFKDKIEDAVLQYLKDKMIYEYTEGN